MRWAKSYSIIDHHLLHGGYLHRLSHQSMSLYLFLVVVADREGRSFYSEATIMGILRLSKEGLEGARFELIKEGLIDYRRPYWWVRNISRAKDRMRDQPQEMARVRNKEDQRGEREFAKEQLQHIFRMLSEN